MRTGSAALGLLVLGVAQADEETLRELAYGDLHISGSPPLFATDETLMKLLGRDPDPRPEVHLVLAANGGGYRASSTTAGVMLALGAIAGASGRSLLEEVDAFSTVSGGGFPVLRYLQDSREDAGCGPMRSGWVSVPKAGCEPQDTGGVLGELRTNLDLPALLRTKPKRVVAALAKAGFDRDLTLSQLTDDPRLPGWIPNSSLAPDGSLLPITADRVALRGQARSREDLSLPASLALMASSAVPGAIQPVPAELRGGEPLWLMDGAWADRLGLISALDLVTSGEADRRVVIVVDSRPQPQFDRDLLASISGNRLGTGLGPIAAITRRTQLIGAGIELSRYRTDEWLMNLVFGPGQAELGPTARQALLDEGYERCPRDSDKRVPFDDPFCSPDRFGALTRARARRANHDAGVDLLRLGTDTLLQPDGWGEAYRTEACERVAARHFTVLALQPTDLSLTGYYRIEQESAYAALDRAGLSSDRRFYPYSEDDETAATRQAALLAAGALNVLLHLDALSQVLGFAPSGEAMVDAKERLSALFADTLQVNFRSHADAMDWYDCTGVEFWVGNEWEGDDHINDNCECRAVVDGKESSFLMRGGSCKDHEAIADEAERPTACQE